MKSAITVFSFFISIALFAQPAIEWQKSLGGNAYEFGQSIHQTSDGGYVVFGSASSTDGDITTNHGNYDFWIAKLNAAGSIEWQRSLGGSGYEQSQWLELTSDGGYVLAGLSNSSDGDVTGHHGDTLNYDCWIVKLNHAGMLEWEKSLGGSNNDFASTIKQTTDGGYIVGATSQSNNGDVSGHHGDSLTRDYWVVKLDPSGSVDWQKSFGGSFDDVSSSILQTNDNGYLLIGSSVSDDGDVTGHHGSTEYNDVWVIKLSSSGTLDWQKSFGGSNREDGRSVQHTIGGGFVVAGSSYSNDGDVTGHHGSNLNADFWIFKLSPQGNLEWQKSLGGSHIDESNSIDQTIEGGFVVTGTSNSNDGDVTGNHGLTSSLDYWVVKTDLFGNIEWQKSLGGTMSEQGYFIEQTSEGGYILTGRSSSYDGDVTGHHGNGTGINTDVWIVKLSPDYIPLPKATANWNMVKERFCPSHQGRWFYSIRYNGDTLAGNKNYIKLDIPYYYADPTSDMECTVTSYPGGYAGALRQDTENRKVYFLPPDSTNESLLYDFSMAVGDTLKGYLATTFPATVVSINQSTTAEGQVRKQWMLVSAGDTIRFIEGVGSSEGLLSQHIWSQADVDRISMLCMSIGTNLQYQVQGNVNCTILTANSTLFSIQDFNLYPNPAEDFLTLETVSTILSGFLMDGMGKEIPVTILSGNQVDIRHLKAGLYFLKFQTQEGVSIRKVVKR